MRHQSNTSALRVIVQTAKGLLVKCPATELSVEDRAGRFTVAPAGDPVLTALVPHDVVIRQADGSELIVSIGFGSLTVVGNEVRIVAAKARLTFSDAFKVAV